MDTVIFGSAAVYATISSSALVGGVSLGGRSKNCYKGKIL